MFIYKLSLHDIKSDVWSAMSATRITDHIYSQQIGITATDTPPTAKQSSLWSDQYRPYKLHILWYHLQIWQVRRLLLPGYQYTTETRVGMRDSMLNSPRQGINIITSVGTFFEHICSQFIRQCIMEIICCIFITNQESFIWHYKNSPQLSKITPNFWYTVLTSE